VRVCVLSGLGGVQVHGNGWHALGILDSTTASVWHGRGAAHGWSRAELTRGIDPGVQN
jgi:hypothetical protein